MWLKIATSVLSGIGLNEVLDFFKPENKTDSVSIIGRVQTYMIFAVLGVGAFLIFTNMDKLKKIFR